MPSPPTTATAIRYDARVVGLGDLFGSKKRRAERARQLELRGELAAAVEQYLEAELPEDAARVVLLRADAEPSAEGRILLCAQAARLAPDSELGRSAARRKALLRFDVARAGLGGPLQSELALVAAELEATGAAEQAAQAYALLGDREAELRVLAQAGAIEQLEGRLGE